MSVRCGDTDRLYVERWVIAGCRRVPIDLIE